MEFVPELRVGAMQRGAVEFVGAEDGKFHEEIVPREVGRVSMFFP
jgi:hypothetical protein